MKSSFINCLLLHTIKMRSALVLVRNSNQHPSSVRMEILYCCFLFSLFFYKDQQRVIHFVFTKLSLITLYKVGISGHDLY